MKSKPDAILAYTFYPTKESLDAKLPPKAKVLRFDCECSGLGPSAMRGKVKLLGILLGAREKANEYLEWHDRCLSQVEERIGDITPDNRMKVSRMALEFERFISFYHK
ncbi:MAG: hypothetical protein WA137_04835 [Methanothrix sp.]